MPTPAGSSKAMKVSSARSLGRIAASTARGCVSGSTATSCWVDSRNVRRRGAGRPEAGRGRWRCRVLRPHGLDLREDRQFVLVSARPGALAGRVCSFSVNSGSYIAEPTRPMSIWPASLRHVAHHAHGPVGLGEGGHLFQEHRAGFGEFHAALGAQEKARAELLFERLDLLAQGGLGDAQLFRRAREVQFFGRGDEVTELAEIHGGFNKKKFYRFNCINTIDWLNILRIMEPQQKSSFSAACPGA